VEVTSDNRLAASILGKEIGTGVRIRYPYRCSVTIVPETKFIHLSRRMGSLAVAFSLNILALPVLLSCVRMMIALSVWRLGKDARPLSITSWMKKPNQHETSFFSMKDIQ